MGAVCYAVGFLDAYFDGHLKPSGIRSLDTAAGRLKVLKQYFGELPVKALEEPAVINRFKAESEYAARVEIATLHKVLALLRASIRWGQTQTPPLIDKSPFHRFGVRLNVKAETVRDRRLSRDEKRPRHQRARLGARGDRAKLQQSDLDWHDLRHEGACRLLGDGADIRIIRLMLGHASAQQTQRYLNVTDEELRKGLEGAGADGR